MRIEDLDGDMEGVLITAEELQTRLRQLATQVDSDYAGHNLLIVGVLKGAVMVVADFVLGAVHPGRDGLDGGQFLRVEHESLRCRANPQGPQCRPGRARDVLIVEDILDSGLTLSWLLRNLRSRGAASVEVLTLLRKPDAMRTEVDVRYLGFHIPQRLRGGVWPGLRREVPQPGLRGQAVAARLRGG